MDWRNKAPSDVSKVDALLLPFLEASTTEEEEDQLTNLINEHISPLITQILRHKLPTHLEQKKENHRNQDLEEVRHEIQLHLLKRIYDLKSHAAIKPVVNLRSYVAATARNACDEYIRRKFPQRRNLRDHIRYCLLTNDDLVLWKGDGQGWLSGLSAWNKHSKPALSSIASESKSELLLQKLQSEGAQRLDLYNLTKTILQIAGEPLAIDQLTTIIAKIYGVEDHAACSFDGGDATLSERLASPQATPAEVIEYREHLEHLWEEICQLPRRQRVALLCNLKDQRGINVITLFPATGAASFEQIANALEIPPLEFETLWSKLPLDDLSLAKYLGISRQQVINLRRNARDRLMRRMKGLEGKRKR